MLRSRIIPCLLLKDHGLVKTVKFKSPKYVGDPINAVRIFNEKQVDELIVLDIEASAQGRPPSFKLIEKLAAECRMPLCYGGGIRSLNDAKTLINLGVEKIALGSSVLTMPDLIGEISEVLGSQSVVCVLDVKKRRKILGGGYFLTTLNGSVSHKEKIMDVVADVQSRGAGEIVVNSIDSDGEMQGYDIELARLLKPEISIPVTFLGGCGSLSDITELIECCGTVGAAAGSYFVFNGRYKAVLISYISASDRALLDAVKVL